MANETVTGEYSIEIQLIADSYPAAPKILEIPTLLAVPCRQGGCWAGQGWEAESGFTVKYWGCQAVEEEDRWFMVGFSCEDGMD